MWSFDLFPKSLKKFRELEIRHWVGINIGICLLYYMAARFGLQLQFAGSQATPIWPPSGIAIGVCLLFGMRALPGVFVGAMAANLVDFYLKGGLGFNATIASVVIGIGNMGEAWLACALLRSRLDEGFISDKLSSALSFVLGVLLACLVSSTVGVMILTGLGFLPPAIVVSVFGTWWVGDVVGALVVAPALLWCFGESKEKAPDKLVILFAIAGLSVLSGMTFLAWGNWKLFTAQAYMLLPILMLLTLKFGRLMMVVAMLVVAGFSIFGTINGLGPFANTDSNIALILLQGFIGVLVVSLLFLDAIHHERQLAAVALEEANAFLEQRVLDRTQQLEKTNQELARSNKELDDFAYIASHDLKEPLRGIENQLAFLIEDYGSQLSPEVHERLNKIPPIAKHLENLIQSLLHFSRVGRVDMAIGSVDLNIVINDVLGSLSGRLEAEKIEIRRPAPLPAAYCDHARIGEVFRNLITNAMKYNDKPERWIEIAAIDKDGETIFYVEDNGIGIQEKHREKVFQIFKRLHSQEKFGGGTGAGMTICQKIVERHGGRIWIESEYGKGSRFCFTLKSA